MERATATKLAAKALNPSIYEGFSDAWEKAGRNLARTCQALEKPFHLTAQRAYLFGLTKIDDPRTLTIVAPLAEIVGQKVPPEAEAAFLGAIYTPSYNAENKPTDIAREYADFFKTAEKGLNSRAERTVFSQARALGQGFEKIASGEMSSRQLPGMLWRAAPVLEDVGMALHGRGHVEGAHAAFALSRQALSEGSPQRNLEVVRD